MWCSCIDVDDIVTATQVEKITTPKQAARADEQVKKQATKVRKNDCSPAQEALIARLMEQKGIEQDVIELVVSLSDNDRRNRQGKLSKKEATRVIEYLFRQPDIAIEAPDLSIAWTAEDVQEYLNNLGRKVEYSDFDELDDAGRLEGFEGFMFEWAKTQVDSDFDWLANAGRAAETGTWKPSLAKGVANCYRAALRRGDVAPAGQPEQGDGPQTLAQMTYDEVEELDGVHVDPDGMFWKVQHNRRHDSHYGKRAVIRSYPEWDEDGNETEGHSLDWVYEGRKPLHTLTAETRLNPEQAKEFGMLYGMCCRCGRELTDEFSIEHGIGPVCAKRQGFGL
jgi:hypothetical protein